MRIVTISRGNFVHLRPFLAAMRDRGWEVHLAALSPWEFKTDGIACHPCYGFDNRWLKPLSYGFGTLRLRRLIRRLQPDLVWGHYVSSAGTVAWLAGERGYSLTVHGSDVLDVMKRPVGRFFLKNVFRCAGQVHTVSRQTADAVVDLGADPSRVAVIPFGIEIERIPFRPVTIGTPLRLICTRSLEYAIYDIPTLLRSVAILHRQGVPVLLTLCGRGQLQTDLEKLAGDLGILEVVSFKGGYQPDELVSLLRAHDVYVSCSLSDGASLSLMEAMAGGLYPVLSDIPANRHWIADNCGSFFPPGDAQGLADRLLCLHDGELPVATAIKSNREFVESHGDRAKAMRQVLEFVANASG